MSKRTKKFPKHFYIFILVLIIFFLALYFLTKHQSNENSRQPLVSETNKPQVSLTQFPFSPIGIDYLTPTRIEYKNIRAYGLEITEMQMDAVIKYINAEEVWSGSPSSYFSKNDKWYSIAGYQEQTLYVKNPYICESNLLWCGSLNTNNPEQVEEEKKRCLTYNIDFNNVGDWIKSNAGQCCKGLIDNVSHILSCVKVDRNTNNPLSEELLFTYQLLKDSGVDCNLHNCPPALEKEIIYY